MFEQTYKYLQYTSDYKFVEENLYEQLTRIIDRYIEGIDLDDNNIFLDIDYLISSGTATTQNTWMDAKHGIYSITPRNGKAVEINAMWYNALKIIQDLSIKFGEKKRSKRYKELAEKCKKSFNEKFYNKDKKSLYDVLGDDKIRPNQLFALSLTYQVIDPETEIAKEIFETVTKKLLNPYGLKTLSKEDDGYIEIYEGDSLTRDSAYHQGITWPWLLGIYYNSLKNIIKETKNKTYKKELEIRLLEFKEDVEKTFKREMEDSGAIGSISEIYDSKEPQLPKGTFAQSWSVAEIFRIIQEK